MILTAAIDAGRIGPNVSIWNYGAAVPVGCFRGNKLVSAEPRKFGLFRNASKTTLHPCGTTIFREGDEGYSMFAIKRGSVAIMVDGNTVDTLTDEEIFGEMALLEHATRTATVVTLEER